MALLLGAVIAGCVAIALLGWLAAQQMNDDVANVFEFKTQQSSPKSGIQLERPDFCDGGYGGHPDGPRCRITACFKGFFTRHRLR